MVQDNRATRMPPLTAALALEAIGLETTRDEGGMEWCAAENVGARRRKMGHALLYIGAAGTGPEHLALPPEEVIRDQCRLFLAGICHNCPHTTCPMKLW